MIFHTNELFSCRVLKKVKDYTIFPLVWLNEVGNERRKPSRVVEIRQINIFLSSGSIQTAMLDDETADMFKKELMSRIQMLEIAQQVLLGVGIAIFVLCLVSYCVVTRRSNQSKLIH